VENANNRVDSALFTSGKMSDSSDRTIKEKPAADAG